MTACPLFWPPQEEWAIALSSGLGLEATVDGEQSFP
jgi:hypothetical protein